MVTDRDVNRALMPARINSISGSSTMPWPIAIRAPAWRERVPAASVAAVTGPGAMTPDMEITIACSKKMIKPANCHGLD